ncbi:crossover junction endodeoxyribonuclease RuvC [Candidatus Woesebacteria bacterium CG22_combo_CG10-13_8_21_14_all_45_10]|uniref:Crossover junction endodeoxyribonuclease RuvC n=1 Tax=Candidatus Woesebacteria bacterium CG22_combo_CG10-13_8_21_14_all_45_10 TaxID=1975060 RepID=A0A2H0BHC0_9BACT|nr:MAG: crossover junction endodeoxyribonuclease RuvC [Candidatus Woesebacteria bacterium CG22_combo_CG10-13_8_21_14_all_45_10]
MRILGIDPGTATTGFGLIETGRQGCQVIEWGLVETDKKLLPEVRLEKIFKETERLIKRLSPDIFAFEKIFFAANAKTAISVGQAQGVMLLAASRCKIKVAAYAPGTVKKTIAGNGRANKKEVARAVRKILGSKVKSGARKRSHFDNCADALAIALTHVMKEGEK